MQYVIQRLLKAMTFRDHLHICFVLFGQGTGDETELYIFYCSNLSIKKSCQNLIMKRVEMRDRMLIGQKTS